MLKRTLLILSMMVLAASSLAFAPAPLDPAAAPTAAVAKPDCLPGATPHATASSDWQYGTYATFSGYLENCPRVWEWCWFGVTFQASENGRVNVGSNHKTTC